MTDEPVVSGPATHEGTAPGAVPPAAPRTAPDGLERRGLLRAAGVTGLVVLGASTVAACSSSTASPGTAAPGSAGSAGSGAAASSAGAPAGGGIPVSSVPVGGGAIFADQKVVVTQPVAGTFKAFDTRCPHRGCAVNSISDKQIHCPCHQSAFDITTGARVAGPAETGLTARSVAVSGDTLSVT